VAGAGAEPEVWLAVETATPLGSVALWRDGLVLEQTIRIQGAHSERVLPAIDHALQVTGTEPEALTALVVGCGPGSFTGVRVAASLAKGWAKARGTPLFAYSSLAAVAAGVRGAGPVCPMFDAKRGEVYAACYEMRADGLDERLAPGAWRVAALLRELARRDLSPAFCGDGAVAYEETIRGVAPEAPVWPEHLGVPRAASLLWLRKVAPEWGYVDCPEAWEPLYVREWRARPNGGEGHEHG
jgi:tRNA threonylcarbamoyladenosine biosynthesis protein TsaB